MRLEPTWFRRPDVDAFLADLDRLGFNYRIDHTVNGPTLTIWMRTAEEDRYWDRETKMLEWEFYTEMKRRRKAFGDDGP